jgi:two-component system sensor histidine kinase VicK
METTPSTRSTEMTEVLSGEEHVMSTMLKFLSKAHKIDSCGDYKAPSLILEVRQYKKLLSDIKAKGIQLRYISDITKDKIHSSKELLKFAKEVRHLAGMRANFSVSETEYMASASIQQQEENQQQQQQQEQPIPQVIYSNAKDLVEQQKYVFESLGTKLLRRTKDLEK